MGLGASDFTPRSILIHPPCLWVLDRGVENQTVSLLPLGLKKTLKEDTDGKEAGDNERDC